MPVLHVPRREFVTRSAAGLVLVATPLGAFAQTPRQQTGAAATDPKRPDPLAPAMVQDFVRKAHADLAGNEGAARRAAGAPQRDLGLGRRRLRDGHRRRRTHGQPRHRRVPHRPGRAPRHLRRRHARPARHRPCAADGVAGAAAVEGPARHPADASRARRRRAGERSRDYLESLGAHRPVQLTVGASWSKCREPLSGDCNWH